MLVPELTVEQATRLLRAITARPGAQAPPRRGSGSPAPGPAATPVPGLGAHPNGVPGGVPDGASDGLLDGLESAAGPAQTHRREEHLLADYADIVPANPRLIRRVANAWAMLEALKLHLGHDEPDDVVVRAAILFVAYPSLVDQLLDRPTPPEIHAPGAAPADPAADPWSRPDVVGVLRRRDGTLVDARSIGACYGKLFPAAHPA